MWSANLLIKRCGIARACNTTTEECRAYFESLVLCVKCVCTISYPTKSHERNKKDSFLCLQRETMCLRQKYNERQ